MNVDYDKLFRQYGKLLENKVSGAELSLSQRINADDYNDRISLLAHAKAMCSKAIGYQDVDREKAARWLGFVQGVLVTSGLLSIDDCRMDVMGVDRETE